MVTMDNISTAIIMLVRIGAVARFIYCMVRLQAAEEQAAQYKKEKSQKRRYFLYPCRINMAVEGFDTVLL